MHATQSHRVLSDSDSDQGALAALRAEFQELVYPVSCEPMTVLGGRHLERRALLAGKDETQRSSLTCPSLGSGKGRVRLKAGCQSWISVLCSEAGDCLHKC